MIDDENKAQFKPLKRLMGVPDCTSYDGGLIALPPLPGLCPAARAGSTELFESAASVNNSAATD